MEEDVVKVEEGSLIPHHHPIIHKVSRHKTVNFKQLLLDQKWKVHAMLVEEVIEVKPLIVVEAITVIGQLNYPL
jgi:hypothetical protein